MSAATLVARTTPVRSRSTEILCAGSLSIVVEGVDGEPACREDVFEDDSFITTPHGGSRRGSRASIKEETDNKIAFFKTEAAARLNELERLLDEHDQIIRELQRSESTGRLHVIGTTNQGSRSASPVDGCKHPLPTISRTAPTSPALGKPRLPE